MTKKNLHGWIVLGLVWLLYSSSVCAQIGDVREYVIGVGDQFSINVWGVPELSSQVAVRQDGKITMPPLGDIQAAGLKISSLKAYLESKEEGKETIGKYVSNPNITISLSRSAENVRISIRGAISQTLNVPRQTSIGQVLTQVVPNLPASPPPQLEKILVVSAEGEEFPVNWPELQSGQASHMDVHLEWGDEIRIPVGALPTPTPMPGPMSTPSAPPKVSYSEEKLQQLLQEYPDALESVMAAASDIDDGVFYFDLAEMDEAQQEALGEDIIALLFYGSIDAMPDYFTDIALMGISVNLRLDEVLEAYLAFPAASPEELPDIKRFREGELLEEGSDDGEDIYLKEILDEEKVVVVEQGDTQQTLALVPPFSEAALAGIFKLGGKTKAVFSGLPERQSRKPRKRMFFEGEKLGNEVEVAKISSEWVILQKGKDLQLLLLRDSFNRPIPEADAPPAPVAPIAGEGNELQIPQNNMEQLMQNLPQEALQNALPDELKALDTFSTLFFATPIFE